MMRYLVREEVGGTEIGSMLHGLNVRITRGLSEQIDEMGFPNTPSYKCYYGNRAMKLKYFIKTEKELPKTLLDFLTESGFIRGVYLNDKLESFDPGTEVKIRK